jgi:NAD-dependent SIR2 family protein deacetylase
LLGRSLSDLIEDIKKRRSRLVNDLPPVLLLGAGASVHSGIWSMKSIMKYFKCNGYEEFYELIDGLSVSERYRYLAEFLATNEPTKITPGYEALAALCADKYFDIILTTNFDPLLEDALASSRLRRKDYILIVNGVIRHDWFEVLLKARSPELKIIKLHGDLFHRVMAWTPKEMNDLIIDIEPQLTALLHERDIVIVGHSLKDSPKILDLILKHITTIWYTNPATVPNFLVPLNHVKAIIGPECEFDKLFMKVAIELGAKIPTAEERSGILATNLGLKRVTKELTIQYNISSTMDDFIRSIVSICNPSGVPYCTGFILENPRAIITDGNSINLVFPTNQENIDIKLYDGRHFKSKVKWRDSSHRFGPVTIELPPDLKFPGLRLTQDSLKPDLLVHVGVAAGERVGISSGIIRQSEEKSILIASVGVIDRLVEIDCAVTPGSSGAPVVDDNFAVRGFIVASTQDPPSYMYPSYAWITPRL